MNPLMRAKVWKTYLVYIEKQHGFSIGNLWNTKSMFLGKIPQPLNCIVIHRSFLGVGQNSGWFLWAVLPLAVFPEPGLWSSYVHAHFHTGRCFILFSSEAQASRLGIAVTKIHLKHACYRLVLENYASSRNLGRKNRGKDAFIEKKKL